MDFNHLLNAQTDAPMATAIRPIPDGEYLAMIEEVEIVTISINKGQRAGQEVPQAKLTWNILDESVKANLNRDKVTVPQDLWLDLDSMGNLDTGPDKNVKLGQIRAALGMNGAGFTLGMLKGSMPCMIKVNHRVDDNDKERIYNGVARVTSAR